MKVILFGASNFSKSVDFYLSRESNYKVVAYTDNKKALEGNSEFNGKPLCSFDLVEKIYPPTEFKMFVAVGYVKLNAIRKYFIEKAIEKGYELKVGKFPFTASGKAKASGAPDGFVKVIFDAKYGEWLGCHMIGAGVTDMIAEAVVARKLETTGHEILKSIHPHPTMSEAVMEAVADAYGEVIHL